MRFGTAFFALFGAALTLAGCTTECTAVGCDSRLEVDILHALPLGEGPYRLEVTTPLHSLRCSFGPALEGEDTCFGFRFSDLSWDEERVSLSLLNPFFDDETNPDAEPFDSVEVAVFRGTEMLVRETVTVDAGTPNQPNGPGCEPTCWTARGELTLP